MISQPRYLPALNYLQRIYSSKIFVILDDVQHQRRCVEHRNKIISNGDSKWLSIEMDRAKTSRPIIKDLCFLHDFCDEHYKIIKQSYVKSAFYNDFIYKEIYSVKQFNFVQYFIESLERLFNYFGLIMPKIVISSSLKIEQRGSEKIANICKATGIDEYISGPNGKLYLDKNHFEDIRLYFHDFQFPVYKQLAQKFIPWVSWIDAYFNEGFDFVKSQITNPMVLTNE